MSWQDIMRRVLPPIGGVEPHNTSPFGATYKRPPDSTNPHRGVDFNYNVPGQQGINLTHPPVYAPVDGVVTNAGQGTMGRIAIKDANGFSHEILHTQQRHVAVGDRVAAGQAIGTMGATGTHQQHVHYQLKDPGGHTINPMAFWDQQAAVGPNPAPPAYLGEYEQYLRGLDDKADNAVPPDEASMPDGSKDVRRLVRVSAPIAAALIDMAAKPVAPFNEISPDRPASFDDRFGDWASSPQASAPRGSYQPGPPQQGGRPLGIVSGKPMPDYPFPPQIWGRPNDPGTPDDDWFTRLFKSAR